MANLIPIVTPTNGSQGNETEISPYAIFPESIDVGSITNSSCFLVSIRREDVSSTAVLFPPNSFKDFIISEVSAERLDLHSNSTVTTHDYGLSSDLTRGKKYRTKITINPDKPLDANSNYAIILSKDLTKTTVFDAEVTSGSSPGVLETRGVYSKTTPDTYLITVTNSGTPGLAKYTWTRSSDSFTSTVQTTKERFIEIDSGVKIKFEGNFNAGTIYRIRVYPADHLNDYFSWTMSTGSQTYEIPKDDRSDALLNIPTNDPSSTAPTFFAVKITPEFGTSYLYVPRHSTLTIGDVTYVAINYGNEYDYYTIRYTDTVSAGSESVAITGKDITIGIEDGVSSALQIVDAFNASLDVNLLFTASVDTTREGIPQTITAKKYFSGGKDKKDIVIEFNKDIDPTTITHDNVCLFAEALGPDINSEDLRFSFTVSGKILTLSLLDDDSDNINE